MVYSQKYCLVQMLSPAAPGYEFSADNWPPHVTIAGVFAFDRARHQAGLARLIASHPGFTSKTADVDLFGAAKNIKVRRLELTPELYKVHESVTGFIERHGGVFNEPQFAYQGYIPHITMTGDTPRQGEIITFCNLALIDMFPGSDHTRRRVISFFPLLND